MTRFAIIAGAFAALQLAACSGNDPMVGESGESKLVDKPAEPVTPTPPPVVADAGAIAAAMPANIHWFRNSAEYQATTRQVYALAGLTLAQKVEYRTSARGWAVVLDADETVLNNSQQQKESAALGLGFSPERWTAWVERKEATAIPGAKAFLKRVHQLGGKVVIVTNRSAAECPATEANLHSEGLEYDVALCKQDTSDKNPRFKSVEEGKASASLPALDVVMFVGDNIQDFPDQSQALRTADDGAFVDFGSRFFVLPNPMYGSWEKNPQL